MTCQKDEECQCRKGASCANCLAEAEAIRPTPKPIRLELERNQLCQIIDALDDLIEGYKWSGGLELVQAEMELHDELSAHLSDFDKGKRPD